MAIIVIKQGGQWVRFTGTAQINAAKVSELVDAGVWSASDLDQHGLVVAEPFVVPEGEIVALRGAESFEYRDGKVWQVRETVPMPRRMVRKSTIIARLTDQQLEDAMSILTLRQAERWRAPDQPAVYFDDPDMIAVLSAVGADVDEVMREGDEA